MNTSENKPLLQDESAAKVRIKVRPHSIKGFIILCFVSYFMVQPSGLYTYIINEWTQFTIKQEYLFDPNVQTKTNSCQNLNHSSEIYRNLTRVQQESAKWIMFNHLASYIVAFFVCLVLPPFSDTYGRRFFIILSLSGVILKNVGAAIIIYTKQHFIYMVVAYGIEGCTGSSLAFYSVSFSYIADVMTDNNKRVFSIVIFEATLMLSTMLSAIVSGFLIDNLGYANSSFVCLGMLLISLVIAIAALPESLSEEHRRSSNSILMTLKRPFEFYTTDAFKGKRSRYIIFLLAFGFVELSSLNRTTIETIYLLGQPFCFSPTWIGYFSFARHFGEAVIGLGSVRLLQIFLSNEAIAILSTVSSGTSFVVEAFAASKLMMFMGRSKFCFASLMQL